MGIRAWHFANRMRQLVGKPAQPKQCCRKYTNRVRHTEPGLPSNIEVQKCIVCGCRHFEALIEPGQFKVRV